MRLEASSSGWRLGRIGARVSAAALVLLGSARAELDLDSLLGKPVLGRNADGHLEVFEVNTQGQLRHRWQRGSNGDWSAWSELGASFFPGVAVGANARGQMVVFAVSREGNTLQYIQQEATNSLDWEAWRDLGGFVRAPLALVQHSDGRLSVFASDAAGEGVKYIWQTDGRGNWSAWQDLGGAIQPGIVASLNRDGRLELFGIDSREGTLMHCWQLRPDSASPWSKWGSLGSQILPGFVVGQNVAGRMEVFAVNATNQIVQRRCQVNPSDSEHWAAWEDFGAKARPGLAIGQSADGRLELLAVEAGNSTLLHRWEKLVDASDQWADWASLGHTAQPSPAVARNEDGNLEVFAVDAQDPKTINHRRQISRASDWLDWSSLDHRTVEYSSRIWQTDEGLPDNLVQALAQTQDGYLWVGTRAGLARFDGLEFMPCDSKANPELKSTSITALCADGEGSLWVGTEGEGLVRLRGAESARFTRTNGLAGDAVRVIYQSRDGTLWLGTTNGLSRFTRGKFTNYTRAQGLLSDVITSVYEDRKGELWIATGAGLNRLTDGKMDSFDMPNGLPNDSVRGICQDQGGRVWIGSNNGMLWYNWYWARSFYPYNTRYGLSDAFVSVIREDREGNLWVGTYSGLNRFHEGRFYSQLNSDGTPFAKVNALCEDREGDLWVGSEEGLIRLTAKRFSTLTRQQGLSHNNVMSVLEDHSGSLWLATWGGGLDRIKDERVTAYTSTNDLPRGLLLSLCEGKDGSLWIGADFDGGVIRFKDGRFSHLTAKDGLIDAPVKVLCQDRVGRLWIGTSHGLSCWGDGHIANYSIRDHLAGDVIQAICEDRQGRLWFGTDGGLSCWENGRFTNLTTALGLLANSVTALYEDKDQTLWIGTHSGGLQRLREGVLTSYTTQQGLFSDEIFEILEDDEGWLYMSCSRGIFQVSKKDLERLEHGAERVRCIAYTKADGMELPQCNGRGKPAGCKSRDGRLWFPTTKGVVEIDPKTTRINELAPPVSVERVLADRKRLKQPSDFWAEPAPSKPLTVPPGRGELEFHYTALSLQSPENCRFKYKLENADTEWTDAGSSRVAHYNSVPPGRYTFRVVACNKDGVWNEAGASLDLVIRPHLWQTWWLQGLAGLLLLGTASGSALYITRRRMQRRLALLEQRNAIEKERGRIAKDIHDDLGSSLTRIMMLGERAEEGLGKREDVGAHVGKIVSSARQSVQSLDEIVWAVNPENDTLDGLIEYISHYADEFFENTDISCRLEMPLSIPDTLLSAELRHDLFLVVKEAFHNILKHAAASQVLVRISATPERVEILIQDNGRGFEPQKAPTTNGRRGNGLRNMRKRLGEVGGQVEITSAPGQGTSLRISASLDSAKAKPAG